MRRTPQVLLFLAVAFVGGAFPYSPMTSVAAAHAQQSSASEGKWEYRATVFFKPKSAPVSREVGKRFGTVVASTKAEATAIADAVIRAEFTNSYYNQGELTVVMDEGYPQPPPAPPLPAR